ncbi:MAG TPA: ribosome biogenesis GTP-binding protein YihA/YsxC [Gemmatimonadales bacterium]|nr:ribosome biogenesis GTP-binding protein YihA/YsxC [Gemmatimonadales bacterium]
MRGHGRTGGRTEGRREKAADGGRERALPPFGHPEPPASPLRALPVEFVGSFPDPLVRLDPPLPEVALIGRSNVGKSSLVNALVGRPGLARVSGTPGKTTLLNAFRLPSLYLVDLPGYGFARAGKAARAGYRRLITRYLGERPTLAGVVWLLDVRHPPSRDDQDIQDLLIASGRPVLAVLTKADKLTRSAGAVRARELAAALGLQDDQVQLTSSSTGQGIAELGESILAIGDRP